MQLAGPGFEPGSGAPKAPMIVHYTIPPMSVFSCLKPSFKIGSTGGQVEIIYRSKQAYGRI